MTIETIGSPLDRDELKKINDNFETLSHIPAEIIKDIISTNPNATDVDINGATKPSSGEFNNTSDYGANFISKVNGIIHGVWVFSNNAGSIGIGLSEQEAGEPASAQIAYKTVRVNSGWNRLVLNFPLEQNKRYTLFKRNLSGQTVHFRQDRRDSWQSNPEQWIGESLQMMNGRFLDRSENFLNIYFFEIEVVTKIAQIYRIMNDSVTPPQQFYVGDNPPQDAQFWFKPVGDN